MSAELQVDKKEYDKLDKDNYLLLKKWLSVAESQICSLEVLSSQLPLVDSRMEESMRAVSENFVSISSKVKEYDEKVKSIAGGDSFSLPKKLQHISDIIESGDNNKAIEEINLLKQSTTSYSKKYHAALDAINKLSEEISASLSEIIMAIQFQDWVSQNIAITINVLGANIKYLRDEISHTTAVLGHTGEKIEIDKSFTRLLILKFTLGELKNKFVEHLMTHGYIKDPSEIGFEVTKTDDDIELF